MIMDTLSGVVTDYLDRHGLKEKHDNPELFEDKVNDNLDDEYTIDVRN